MMFQYAMVRKPCDLFTKGLSSLNIGKPNFQKELLQYEAYFKVLISK